MSAALANNVVALPKLNPVPNGLNAFTQITKITNDNLVKGVVSPVAGIKKMMGYSPNNASTQVVGSLLPIHKAIYEIESGKFIGTPTWTIMSQAMGIHLCVP
ncbi:hypothetical protein [Clostridium kluyveri]|uniref:Uncharacterized protein n=1 Tax=Clostridium kluyveri TaxID=1534 RepID=A0A1L5F2V5_CLOKL|nr:hypothetical protein [Clostridium kluyveri]APM37317.1 hypothetical protein BS101_00325 [Clostridium kluyveri]